MVEHQSKGVVETMVLELQACLDQKDAELARLKLEAQAHAQEARTANATIAEIYQVISGSTGEPGNWHGAEPVRATLAQKDEEIARLKGLFADANNDDVLI